MKKFQLSILNLFVLFAMAISIIAADHIDAPAVSGSSADLADLYVFESPSDDGNLVFVANQQGLMDPATTEAANFDPNQMIEFNIDNDGDAVEDLVIQCIYAGDKLRVFGPIAPKMTGTTSTINASSDWLTTDLSEYGKTPIIGSANGIKAFAGPRDDPFFFDFNQFVAILGGNATSFNNPGDDTFAGTNVLSTVIEVPKNLLGGNGSVNVWVESKTK